MSPERIPVRRAWLISGLLIGGALASPVSACADQPEAAAPESAPDSSDPAVSRAAADALVARAGAADADAAIRRMLSSPADSGAFGNIVEALGSSARIPASLLPDLIGACNKVPASQKAPLLRAISSIRDRAGAEYLVSLLELPSVDAALRRSALEALVRQSGRDDLGENAARWHELLVSLPSDEAWREASIKALAARADRERDQRAQVQTRLLETLRTLHLATPAERRWPLITSMVGDPLACVNLLGLELISRELSAGNRPDSSIGQQILPLLASPDPVIREQTAILIANLAPEGADKAVRNALDHERVPATASALLNAASRWPSVETEESVLAWIDPAVWASGGTALRDASLDAAWALYRGGMIRSDAAAEKVLAAIRTVSLAELNGSGCRLRAELGDQSDLDAIVVLLGSKLPAQRLATAEALVTSPEFLARILAAAREDPLLIDVAVRGVLTIAPDVLHFAAVEEATRKAPDQRRAALTIIAGAMNEDEILEASRRLRADPALREAVLSNLADPRRIMAERTEPARLSYTAEALVELAELRIELGRYGDALAALEALPEIDTFIPADRLRDLKAISYIGANRLDQAKQLGAKPDVWLRALDLNTDQPQAQQIASTIESGMAAALTDADRAKLEHLKLRIAAKPR